MAPIFIPRQDRAADVLLVRPLHYDDEAAGVSFPVRHSRAAQVTAANKRLRNACAASRMYRALHRVIACCVNRRITVVVATVGNFFASILAAAAEVETTGALRGAHYWLGNKSACRP